MTAIFNLWTRRLDDCDQTAGRLTHPLARQYAAAIHPLACGSAVGGKRTAMTQDEATTIHGRILQIRPLMDAQDSHRGLNWLRAEIKRTGIGGIVFPTGLDQATSRLVGASGGKPLYAVRAFQDKQLVVIRYRPVSWQARRWETDIVIHSSVAVIAGSGWEPW